MRITDSPPALQFHRNVDWGRALLLPVDQLSEKQQVDFSFEAQCGTPKHDLTFNDLGYF